MKETFYEPWDLTTQFSLLISITKLLRAVIDENAICCLNRFKSCSFTYYLTLHIRPIRFLYKKRIQKIHAIKMTVTGRAEAGNYK